MKLRTENGTYKISKNISLVLPQEIEGKYSNEFKIDELNHEDKVMKYLKREISNEEILRNISNLKNLTFQLTQNCNYRCSYCAYSGLYPENRTHSHKRMSLEIGKKAIDFFLRQLHSPLRTIREYPVASFYGGEPFLEYDTMMTIIDYVKSHPLSKKFKIKYVATTNGSLLSQERIDEIVKRGLRVDISIDGPRNEHNKFRITANGEGTWDSIIKNVIYFSNKYPDYFKNNVRFFLTLHPLHDLLEIERFLLENDLFNENNVFISHVNRAGLKIDDSEAVKEGRRKLNEQIRSGLQKDNWVYHKFVAEGFDEKFGNGTSILSFMNNFTGVCFPGGIRLFVDVDGNYHICEKIDGNFPIGDVETGFDFRAIKDIIMKWREQILKRKCWKCSGWYFCSFCFAQNAVKGKFNITARDCKELQKSVKRRMASYLSYKEDIDGQKYNHITDFNSFMDAL